MASNCAFKKKKKRRRKEKRKKEKVQLNPCMTVHTRQ
jgi:hypothetical protein